jgi:uncharacterized protein (DUF1330 family)
MSAYVIVNNTPKNPDKLKEYGSQAGPLVKQFGGELVTSGAVTDVLNGSHDHSRCVILRFDTAEAARAWYNSPEYQAIIPTREEGADTVFYIVE